MLRIPHCLDSRLTDGGKVAPKQNEDVCQKKSFFGIMFIEFFLLSSTFPTSCIETVPFVLCVCKICSLFLSVWKQQYFA
jgi:hypothetical protein